MKVYGYTQLHGVFARPTGVAKHITQMFHGLSKSPDVDFSVLAARDQVNASGVIDPAHPLGDLAVRVLPYARRRIEWTWPLLNRPNVDPWCGDADWIYAPVEKDVTTKRSKLAATVHSLYWFDKVLPQYSTRAYRLTRMRYRLVFKSLIRKADLLLTVSEFLKGQMVDWFAADPSKIVVVGNGAEPEFFEAGRSERGASGRGDEKFVVVVSGLNYLDGAPHVLATARELLGIDPSIKVLVAGHQNEAEYVQEAQSLPNIELLGYQHSRQLAALMRDSVALLFLNRYETFGLGVVEGMAARTPVIGTKFTAVPEIVAGAGLMVDVENPAQIARQVVELSQSPTLREKYIALGDRRAQEFTWDACVQRLLSALRGGNG